MALAAAAQPRDPADLGLRRQLAARLRPAAARARPTRPSRTTTSASSAARASGSSRSAIGARAACSCSKSRRDSEINDNILAYWRPKAADGGRLRGRRSPIGSTGAGSRPSARRSRPSPRTRSGRGTGGRRRRFIVDFTGDTLGDNLPADLKSVLTVGPGTFQNLRLWPYPERKTVRVAFELDPGNENACEMRLDPRSRRETDQRDMALSLDTVSSDSNPNVAALERPASAMPPEKPPRHADPVAPALVGVGGAQARSAASASSAPGSPASSSSAAALLLTAYGTYEMYQVVSVSRTTALQWVLLGCSRSTSPGSRSPSPARSSGFLALLRRPRPSRPPASRRCSSRTAVVMPVYNEPTARTFAALRGDPRIGRGDRPRRAFRLFHPLRHDAIRTPGSPRSAPSWRCASGSGPDARLYYRHRPKNHHRKAGNIADFVSRWGGALRAHARARRRQPDDRRLHRAPRRRHGGRSRRRHHPVAAAHHQPQHALRARSSSSPPGSPARSSPRALPSGWAATAITGATTRSSAPRPSPPMAACRT